MRIIFFGSDDFAAISLKELLQSSHEVVACVTGLDARQGRGMKISLPPIKSIALDHNKECLQPSSLKEPSVIHQLKEFNADIFVVVAYGKILPQEVLNIPKIFCVNVHGSLLPQYRGAAPINWAIMNGDSQTGVTVQKMALALDAGDIISQEIIPLSDHTTADALRAQMAQVGAKLLVRTLDQISTGDFSCTAQDESKVSYAGKLNKDMGRINWTKPAQEIERLIRGLKPWPGTFTIYKGKVLKILEASVVHVVTEKGEPGRVSTITKEGFTVSSGSDDILVKNVHPEGGKAMSAYDFIQGHRLSVGESFI